MQHSDGLYERMKHLNTPEDIKLWKEERKKNYPTLVNLQKQDDERKEQEERREICGFRNRRTQNRPLNSEPIFRYKIVPAEEQNQMYYHLERKLRTIEYEQGDGWMHRSFAPDMKFRNIRVPFASMNKSPIVTLESFYLDVKKAKDVKLEKQKKVKWKGFKVKTLERLPDSDPEMDHEELPISDSDGDDDDVMEDKGEESQKELKPQAEHKAPSLGMSLVNYSSASESENEEVSSAGMYFS